MRDGNKLLTNCDCKYGAPMGRRTINDNPTAVVRLFKVRMVGDGCYDVGGAYWGIGYNPLYACIGEGFQAFTRAPNRATAIANILKDHPGIIFKSKPAPAQEPETCFDCQGTDGIGCMTCGGSQLV